VNYTDTASMLSNYKAGITALNADTATLVARFATKLNTADTANMLAGYRTAISSGNTAITTETNRAINAENVLTAAIATESNRANNAENILTAAIATEKTRAQAAEGLKVNQNSNEIAIGYAAGQYGQGTNAVAIGTFAGNSNQAPNSIILNASGNPLNNNTSGFFVNPIRAGASTQLVYFNTTTNEITYGSSPTIPAAQVQTDWNATSGLGQLLNKPTLSTVATTGSYNDLTNKPTIPSAYSLPTASASTLGGIKVGSNLSIDGSGVLSANLPLVREVADEVAATNNQTSFTLTQTPASTSKVKMYINGVRVTNSCYSLSGNTITYNPGNNGSYSLIVADRIQFDYYY
jgi:hypothetical protein